MTKKQKQIFLNTAFEGIDLDVVRSMNDEALRRFTLEQAERLANTGMGDDVARWFTFHLLDEGGQPQPDNAIAKENDAVSQWVMTLARILYSLLSHGDLDSFLEYCHLPKMEVSVGQFPYIPGTPLEDWLLHSPYSRLGQFVCRQLITKAILWGVEHNGPVQDFCAGEVARSVPYERDVESERKMAGIVGSAYRPVESVENQRAYIKKVLEVLTTVYSHLEKGQKMGLDNNTQCILDSIWGWVPHKYLENYVQCARELKLLADVEKQFVETHYRQWNDIYRKLLVKMKTIADNKYDVLELSTDGYNISIGYLLQWMEGYFRIPIRESLIEQEYANYVRGRWIEETD